jgi:endothelin-converting enzyme/putative endopeptidase
MVARPRATGARRMPRYREEFAMWIRWAASAALAAITGCAAAAGADQPATGLPYTPGLDVQSMDRSADPCVDFYQYSCGGWIRNHPIPADQASWSVYGKLYQDNQRFLWGILDALASHPDDGNPARHKLGDYFAACMDEATVEKRAAGPLRPALTRIGAMRSKSELPEVLAALQPATASRGFFFSFGSTQALADATRVIADADRGGLGLPDRDYYLKDDAKSKDLRQGYVRHVARMLGLLGDQPGIAAREAASIMRLETMLAKAQLSRVERRDPHKLDHPMPLGSLQALTPHFDWSVYFARRGVDAATSINVEEPAYFKAMMAAIDATSLDDIRAYLRWHLVHAQAPYLSSAFVDENFDFFLKTLRGVPQLQPRWKRCVALADDQLGEALGREFVERAFSAKARQDTQHITERIEAAMRKDLEQLDWMSAQTRQRALGKLDAIVNKIGYPDHWRDYGKLAVARDDFAGNVERGNRFESRRQLDKIGKPVDRGEWMMTPPTVNAYYNPQMNDINFPAGVLQPPLYDAKMDAAPTYGDTGGTIGHELTHAFDDEGRQFDAEGNLADWWTPADTKAFNERAQCIVDQYAKYVIVDDIHINSKLTEGEDIADLGGLVLAWMAWHEETAGEQLHPIDGLTPGQRFFVGYAQWACSSIRPEQLRASALVNPHSPPKYRVNGLMVNMPQFRQAFSCREGQPMVAKKPCRVW